MTEQPFHCSFSARMVGVNQGSFRSVLWETHASQSRHRVTVEFDFIVYFGLVNCSTGNPAYLYRRYYLEDQLHLLVYLVTSSVWHQLSRRRLLVCQASLAPNSRDGICESVSRGHLGMYLISMFFVCQYVWKANTIYLLDGINLRLTRWTTIFELLRLNKRW